MGKSKLRPTRFSSRSVLPLRLGPRYKRSCYGLARLLSPFRPPSRLICPNWCGNSVAKFSTCAGKSTNCGVRTPNCGNRPGIGRGCTLGPCSGPSDSKPRSSSFAERTASSRINSSVERAKPLRPRTVRIVSKGQMIRHRPRRPGGASGRIGPARHGGTTATCPWSRTLRELPQDRRVCPRCGVALVAQRHRGFRTGRDRGPSVSPTHPTATLSADMLLLELPSDLHRGARAQADPQGGVGRVGVGGDPARQVRQLPAHRAVARPMAVARPGRGGGYCGGRPGTPRTALSAALRRALETQRRGRVRPGRRDPLDGLRRPGRQDGISLVAVGLPGRGYRGLSPRPDPQPRRARGAFPGGRRHGADGRPLLGVQGHGPGQAGGPWCWSSAGRTSAAISSRSARAGPTTRSGPWPGSAAFASCIATIVAVAAPKPTAANSPRPTPNCARPWRPCRPRPMSSWPTRSCRLPATRY